MNAEEVGKRVRAGRAYAGISQRDLCEEVGISPPTLTRIESGEREPRKWELMAIAHVCGLPMTWFLGELPTSVDVSPEAVVTMKKPPNAAREGG